VTGNNQANTNQAPALTEQATIATPAAIPPQTAMNAPPPQQQQGGEQLTPMDELLETVYGDHVRADDGSQQNGGVMTDRTWQSYWKRMAQVTPSHYAIPKGIVGWHFLMILTNEFRAVRVDRTTNLEKPLVFVLIVLPKTPGVQMAKDIRMRLQQRMDLWSQECYAALVNDMEAEALSRVGTSPEPDEETRA